MNDAKGYVNTQAQLGSNEVAQPIRINCTNLAGILKQGARYVDHLNASAPVQIDRMFGVKTGVEAVMALEQSEQLQREARLRSQDLASTDIAAVSREPIKSMFARGEVVFDKKYARRVTIVQLNAARTTSGRPAHLVIDSRGNSWKQSEKFLER